MLTVVTCTRDDDRGRRQTRQWACLANNRSTGFNIEVLWTLNEKSPVEGLQFVFTANKNSRLIGFIHDDVDILEPDWHLRVIKQFDDPAVGVVGFGGATGLADLGIYKTPYRLQQLARHNYASNTIDAENHGERFEGERDVATLDGFALFVRRELLEKAGGWPVDKLVFHNYDNWLCCMARRLGYRVRLVGVRCFHHGGKTSTRTEYQNFLKERYGKTDADIHRESHEWLYEEFRDVLPIRV